MTYGEAIDLLHGLQVFGMQPGLARTRRLASLVGNPQDRLRFIHVAGTNGKGSTCALLESIYRHAGRRTGLFTSPHLVAFGERIQVNRQLMPEADIARLVAQLRPHLAGFPATDHPTFFEVVTVLALLYFAEQQCDLVIWETGLGGRLDATNIVTPLASVITHIALDHQEWLGSTTALIAAEKAGILKPGVPAVTSVTDPDALAVIRRRAGELGIRLREVDAAAAGREAELPTLPGDHQRLNAATARAVVEVLQSVLPVPEPAVRDGLASVHWPGRLQWVRPAPGRRVLLDGAHNPDGVDILLRALPRLAGGERPVLLFGALADKDWAAMVRQLAPVAAAVHVLPVASPRRVPPGELAAAFRAAAPEKTVCEHGSLAGALAATQHAPFRLITGSLYLVGEALEQLGATAAAPSPERQLNDWSGRSGTP